VQVEKIQNQELVIYEGNERELFSNLLDIGNEALKLKEKF
jgi:hypothetical protein